MRKILAFPFFICVMLLVFYLTFGSLGTWLSHRLSLVLDRGADLLSRVLEEAGVNPAFHDLVIDGICTGVGSVLAFLPVIAVLFFCLALLEGSGYMERMAFLLDRPMRRLGLPGRSIVPLLMGFGCSVPAVMAVRSLPGKRDRLATMLLIPFMSCSAKLPLYAVFAAAFFEKEKWPVIAALYGIGIFLAVLWALFLKKALGRGRLPRSTGFSPRAAPPYRIPNMKRAAFTVWDNTKGFAKKAFTVIFTASILIWFLQSFDTGLNMVDNSENSILAAMGKAAAPLFSPLGFGDWRSATALLTGLSAKEAVLSTLSVLAGSGEGRCSGALLAGLYTPLSAFSFLVFFLLYTPCAATLAAIRKESGRWAAVFLVMAVQFAAALLAAFLVFKTGGLFL